MSVPPSLVDPDLDDVWRAVAARLETQGLDNRGRLRAPSLRGHARLTLEGLLGRTLGATIDLALLEAALARLGVGPPLADALAQLGVPVSPQPAVRRTERQAQRDARQAARERAATWPEPWAPAWIDKVIQTGGLRGLDRQESVQLVDAVRLVLDRLDPSADALRAPVSRVELAAITLGDAHALDPGTRLEAAAGRALAHLVPEAGPRERWERAGAHADLVSGAALTWRLPIAEGHPLARLTDGATALDLPLHLTQMALRSHPAEVPPGVTVLVAENPRVVEAAAQGRTPMPVIATNGNPSGAVRLLLDQLLACGATLRYHGDFDAAGLAMCARLAHAGLIPWKMTTADYLEAIRDADEHGVALPRDPRSSGPTPWDPELQTLFNDVRSVVHEERVLAAILEDRPDPEP